MSRTEEEEMEEEEKEEEQRDETNEKWRRGEGEGGRNGEP